MLKKYILIFTLVLLPAPAFAALEGVKGFIRGTHGIVNALIGLVVALALLAFFWGLVRYIFSAGNEKDKVDGKNIMISGILALFVMTSVWGIIKIVQEIFGVNNAARQQMIEIDLK